LLPRLTPDISHKKCPRSREGIFSLLGKATKCFVPDCEGDPFLVEQEARS
jgi:hypothetical protein